MVLNWMIDKLLSVFPCSEKLECKGTFFLQPTDVAQVFEILRVPLLPFTHPGLFLRTFKFFWLLPLREPRHVQRNGIHDGMKSRS